MTRQFREQSKCPKCGTWHATEQPFKEWIRNHPRLDSRKHGIAVFDCDQIIHRYKIHADRYGSRDVQAVMFIEVKTHGADVTPSQLDTLSMFAQVLRNGRQTPTSPKHGRHASNHVPPTAVYSKMLQKNVQLRLYGGHLLRMSGDTPDDSEWMEWDRKPITRSTLVKLLRFELEPHTLRPMSWRRHHRPDDSPLFAGIGESHS